MFTTCLQTHRQAPLLSDVVFEVTSVLGDLAFLARNNHSRDQMSPISNLTNTKKEVVVRQLGMKRGAGYKLRDGPMESVLLESVSRGLSVQTRPEQMFREKR